LLTRVLGDFECDTFFPLALGEEGEGQEAPGTAEARRILLTRVLGDFECDTFFPLALGEEGEGQEAPGGGRWARAGKEEHDRWVGEEVPGGVQGENGTEYEFQMWERID